MMPDTMISPSEKTLVSHLQGGRFRFGVNKKKWKLLSVIEEGRLSEWPHCLFWIQAGTRNGAPDGFILHTNFAGYPNDPPTTTFWCTETQSKLPIAMRPRGSSNNWIFRVDWNNGDALYHPYDRIATESHRDWDRKYPGVVWSREHTLVDLLELIHQTLNSNEYLGIGLS